MSAVSFKKITKGLVSVLAVLSVMFLVGCGGGTGSIKIVNDGIGFDISFVTIASGEGGSVVNDFTPIKDGESRTYDNLKTPDTYAVGIVDAYGDTYTTEAFELKSNKTKTITYNGFGIRGKDGKPTITWTIK